MSLLKAITWRWPGAQCVVRGAAPSEVLAEWHGPMARPTDPEIAQAVTDYNAQRDAIEADARTDAVFVDASDDLLTALIEQWPAMQAEASAGTLKGNISLYKQRIRARAKVLRRAKPQ